MSDTQTTTCPRCQASFQVAKDQLAQAEGRVRCGNCLQVFDAVRGEADFIPPALPEDDSAAPFLELEVAPMAAADLPEPGRGVNWSAWVILLGLLAALAAQLYTPVLESRAAANRVQLAKLVVRPHPEIQGALRVDALIRNQADEPAPWPLLVLAFTNRQGEPRASRAFLPAEYLHGNQPLRLPPRSEIQVSLALADPGSDAVNYLAHLKTSVAGPG